MSIVFKDFGTAYLASPLAVGGLTITVDNAVSLPILTNGDYFYLVLQKYSDRSYVEIVKVTATAGNTFTILRGQAGTSIRAFAIGDYAELRLTTDGLTEYIAQNIGTKMDKSGGGDFTGLYRFLNSSVSRVDLVRTSDNVASSLVVDFSASEGHRTIIGGTTGANSTTPSILLRPNGYGSGIGQVKIDSNGLVDAVAVNMRGVQGTDAGSAVRFDYLSNFVPKARKINNKDLVADITLLPADIGALPSGGGALSGPLTVATSGSAIVLDSPAAAEALYLLGRTAGTNNWFVGKSGADDSLALMSYKSNTGLFLGNEVSSNKRISSDQFRVGAAAGLIFSPFADRQGVSWAFGMDAGTGDFSLGRFVTGAWKSAPITFTNGGEILTTFPFRGISSNNIIRVNSQYPMFELHSPGVAAFAAYVEPTNSTFRIGTSNGSGNVGYVCLSMTSAGDAYFTGGVYTASGGGYLSKSGLTGGAVYGSPGNVVAWAQASFAPISDASFKTVLADSSDSAFDFINKFRFHKFKWNDDVGEAYTSRASTIVDIGLIAQEVEEVSPVFVREVRTYADDGSVATAVKSLDVAALLSLVLKAAQELDSRLSVVERAV